MMSLCAGLAPNNKTISNFRKENAKPLKKVFREFVLLCKELELITGDIIFLALLQSRFKPLLFAWLTGSSIIIFAMVFLYHFDLPTRYTIVFVGSLCGIVGALWRGKGVS